MLKTSRGIWGKFIAKIIGTSLLMILVSYGICFYQKNVTMLHFSEILTMVSLLYAVICGFISYSGYYNGKNASYMYQKTVQSAKYEERQKLDVKYLNANLNLAVSGICSGLLCFLAALVICLKFI